MKCVIICILLCVVATIAYEDVNDDNLNMLLTDKKLLGEAFGCVVDVNPCDDLGAHAKSHMAEMLKNSCRECDYTQRHDAHAFIVKLRNDYPDLYEKFEDKYDPTRTLLKKFDEEMIKYAR